MSELTHHVEVPATVPGMCLEALSRHAKSDALSLKQQGQWLHIPGAAIIKRVRAVALGLSALGVRKGDRVALLSENRPDWSVTDLAILSLGAVNVPIYTTQAPEQVRYILEDSGARVLFVSGRKVFRHARPGVEPVGTLERVVFFDTDAAEGVGGALSLFELEQTGAQLDEAEPEVFSRALNAVGREDLATIIYTSGTTGEPKGVMLTHSNVVSNLLATSERLAFTPEDVVLSVLPLSHVFERGAMYMYLHHGAKVYFAEAIERIGDNMREVRPTLVVAVPRLFEKIYARIKDKAAEGGRVKT
ncbi:MAG: AMP-binding protein, partial [Acidobacteriota bacterium]|nr:AMP-binding protein [Acidobacteriota bacterium]